jgi:carbamoyl-phosphate synthase small subunit
MRPEEKALLVLEDGRSFAGQAIGAIRSEPSFGEVIFNTSMTGYQEIVSDPSYCGQIVTLTAPQIGNYGVTDADIQAEPPRLSGLVVRELSPVTSCWRAEGSLEGWLVENGVAGITGVDTRALTRHIRERGAMRAGIFSGVTASSANVAEMRQQVRRTPPMEGLNLASRVTTAGPYSVPAEVKRRGRVVVVDFGAKRGILRQLVRRGLELRVVPASTGAEQVLAERPDGVLLSNGPGDPAPVVEGIATARGLIGRVPLFGICLGHQVLALALGARTYKLRFGHHGGNHPVRDERSGEVWITAQNHGFAVDPETLPDGAEKTHVSLYDGTLEGFVVEKERLLAVQFHPEGSPGPHDGASLFDRFLQMIRGSDRTD